VPQFVEVRFKGNRKEFYEWHDSEPLREREPVIVETDRGLDLGRVGAVGRVAEAKCERCTGCAVGGTAPADDGEVEGPETGAFVVDEVSGELLEVRPAATTTGEGTHRVVRRALPADVRAADELRRNEDEVRRRIRERAAAHSLVMKISDAEWQWDRKKLTVFFTSEKRVDFRNLVRDLASLFRTRIELRQIGVRDEAVRLDGIGRCGRRLCSASFLTELRPIGLQIAKDQRLSLNPSQISGPCGRLLCCLRFEHDFYVQARKRFPKEHKTVQTSHGAEKVVSLNIFHDLVTLRAEDGTARTVPLLELRADVERAAGGAPKAEEPAAAPPPPSAPPARAVPAPRSAPTSTPAAPAAPASPTAATGTASAAPAGTPRRRRRRRGGRRPPPAP
jgi:cell fate regulator YaaT (PSP1 superfamily)